MALHTQCSAIALPKWLDYELIITQLFLKVR